ncbi:MAG: hypothetical protein JSU64_00320 [candidate division WOR-3 bacterium]|nr:MAG: hypothetical protein JSU64_00320 [candidate division WOR-3 bacterium]
MTRLVQFGFLLMFLVFCTSENGPTIIDVVDLIPDTGDISGWAQSGEMDVAENETQLWDLIDGAGIVFLDHGFVKCAFQEFSGEVLSTPCIVLLRAFDMGDTTNAYAVYHDNRLELGDEIPWTDTGHAGVEARIETSSLYHKIEMWHDRFFVDITITDVTLEALNVAKLFALNVSDAITQTAATPE